MHKTKMHRPVLVFRVAIMMLLASFMLWAGLNLSQFQPRVGAAPNMTINFQSRLLRATGATVPDGNYNVTFKLYTAASSSGSTQGSCSGDAACVWTEVRTNANRVRVVNGYLTVNLASVAAFGAISWDQELWLTMNIGGTAVSPAWDGEMSPRLKLTAVPYAFRAGQLSNTNGVNQSVLTWATQTASNTIQLPNEGGTICIQNSTSCGFLTSSTGDASYVRLQGATPGTTQTGHLALSGTGIFGSAVRAPLFDTASASALTIGTTNATAINLQQNTVLASGKTLTIQGNTLLQPSSDGTAFIVKSSLGNNQFVVDTANSRVGIGLGANNVPTLQGAGLEIKGALRFSGGGTATLDNYITPLGSLIGTTINITNYNPGNFSQIIAMGLPSTASSSSRAITLLDARSTAHQPTLAVLSPDEQQIGGFSWDGSNTNFLIKNTANGSVRLNVGGASSLIATSTGVGINMTPSYAFDVTGDINSSTQLRIGGNVVCTSTGCITGSGSTNYIQNQNSSNQTANFRISGTGRAETALQAPLFDTAATGTLSIGTTNATAINLNQNVTVASGKTLTVQGGLTQSSGVVSITGNAASSFNTTAGNLTLQAGSGILSFGTTNTLTSTGALTIDSEANALSFGTSANAKTITIGSTVSTGTTNIQAGTGDINFITNDASAGTNIKTATNSTTAFQVQNSSTNTIFNADTVGSTVSVGSTNQSVQLNVTGDIVWGAQLETPQGFEAATTFPTSFTPGTWTAGGSASWSRTTTTAHLGAASATSGTIIDGQKSWMQLNYTFTQAGTLSFYWRVSSEAGFDFLSICLDANATDANCTGENSDPEAYAQISGTTDANWVQVNIPVSAGAHVFRWLYAKDGSTLEGNDRGWIDDVRFTAVNGSGTVRGDQLTFNSSDTISLQNGANPNALYVDSSGRVGVNTRSPSEALTVQGNVNIISQDLTKTFRIRTSGTAVDVETSGTNGTGIMVLSAWTGGNFSGTQYQFLRLLPTLNQPVLSVGTGGASGATPVLLMVDSRTDSSSADPAYGANGSMYYNPTLGVFRCFVSAAWKNCASGVVFASTSVPAAVANTTADTNFNMSYSVPGGGCQPGKLYRVTAQGTYSTTGTPTLQLRLKWGSTDMLASGAITAGSNAVSRGWRMDAQIMCYTVGVSGTVSPQGFLHMALTPTTVGGSDMRNTAAITFDTTTTQDLVMSAQWSVAAAQNAIGLRQFIVEAL